MYNTLGAGDAAAEEQTKIASLDLFAKAAAAEQIQLSELSPEQQNDLYNQFCEKLAQEEGEGEEGGEKKPPFPPKKEEGEKKEKEEEEEKESAARAEYAAQQEWQQKTAEADYLGRQMAHAFWSESGEIQKVAMAKEAKDKPPAATKPGVGPVAKGTVTDPARQRESVGKGLKRLGKDISTEAGKAGRFLKQHKGKAGLGLAAAGGAAFGAKKLYEKGKKEGRKEASAFDAEAAMQGLRIAEAAELGDLEEIENKLASVLNLNLLEGETEKVAQTNDYDTALNVRGLEFLEAAGFEVDWNEVFS